jgi:hypothetical protein
LVAQGRQSILAKRRRAAMLPTKGNATVVRHRHVVEQVAGGAAGAGVSIKPQDCPRAESELSLISMG